MLINPYRFGGLWTPANITTALWLDAADASTVTTVDGGVSEWRDKSGNSRHGTQSVAASRPSINPTALNNLPGLVFDGSDDRIIFQSALLSLTHTLFIVFIPVLGQVTGSLFGQWAAGQNGRYLWSVNQNASGGAQAGRLNIFNSSATQGGTGGVALDVGITNTGTIVSSLSRSGTGEWKLHKNGTQWDSATVSELFTGVNSSIGTVNATSSVNPYNGTVLEVVHLSSYATQATRQLIEGYLAHKWGLAANLPSDHPYKSAAPAI